MQNVKHIARMIDHALLHPSLTEEALRSGCKMALEHEVASVCIKPYAVSLAATILQGSPVAVCTVIGFPHGSNDSRIKVAEAELACQDGASELDMVVNIGKVLNEEWQEVKTDIQLVLDVCRSYNALLKVIFENDFLPDDRYKIKLCEICNELQVDFVKTSTGFGFVKQASGMYTYQGATDHDLKLMRLHTHDSIGLKASGGVRTLEDALRVIELGVTRIGTSSTASILSSD